MRLLLIFSSWTYVFGDMKKVAKGASTFPPLNLLYLAAIAEKHGHTAQVIDGEAEQLSSKDMIERVLEFKPDIIGFTCTTPMYHIVCQLAQEIKNVSDAKIVVGGPHITYFREKVFYEYLDYLVIGDCEGTFGPFLNAIDSKEDISKIPGIVYRKNGNVIYTGNNTIKIPLDEVPLPARSLLKLDLYNLGTMKGRKKYTSIMTSTGCPFKCAFCSTLVYGKKVNTRSVENVIEELRHVIINYGITHFYFIDSTLTLNRKYILKLCNAIEKANLKFTWEGSTRANLVDEELIARMKECGLIRLSFGLETADPDVSKIIMKGVPIEKYVQSNKLTNKYGIETINSVMLGLPGDTYESINKTIAFVRGARDIKHATFGIAMPYPGSLMYEWAVKGEYGLKLLTDDFSQFQRYNSAVMSVNGIQPSELIRLQKVGLLKIYLVPFRIIPMIKRFGMIALVKPFFSALFEFLRQRNKVVTFWR